MTEESTHASDPGPAVGRILAALDDAALVWKLSTRLSAADLTSVLIAAARERASMLSAPAALSRYRGSRFTLPGKAPFLELRRVEEAFVHALRDPWQWLVLSPVVPFGAHHVLGDVSQDWVVTTVRASEMAADPTVGLALEVAARRRSTATRRSAEVQRLAAIQRVTRAQRYTTDDSFSHFTMFGLVTAGRSVAGGSFDVDALHDQLSIYVEALRPLVDQIEIALSVGRGSRARQLLGAIRRHLAQIGVIVAEDTERMDGQRYYVRACFKINVVVDGERLEIGDGGFTDWTERLLDDRHERMLVSGAGLDRLALALTHPTWREPSVSDSRVNPSPPP